MKAPKLFQITTIETADKNVVAITGRTGKLLGKRFVFNSASGYTPSSARLEGKANGLKGNKLTQFVNAKCAGDNRQASLIMAQATVTAAAAAGVVFEHADVKAKSFVLKGTMVTEPTDASTKKTEKLAKTAEQIIDDMAAGKITVEQARELLAAASK